MEDFSSLSIRSYAYLYKGLLALIDSECGYGFLNSDKGHPAYRSQPADYKTWGDDHEHNKLYQLLVSLKAKIEGILNESGGAWTDFDIKDEDVIRSWEQFCKRAVRAHKKYYPI